MVAGSPAGGTPHGPAVYLGLGTNLGDRLAILRRAVARLRDIVALDAVSSVYRTEPVGYRDQPDFWNVVVRGRTSLPPERLLAECQAIEREVGREPSFRFGPRLLDIDLLLYDGVRVSTPALAVPHPRMTQRAFVLVPLLELEPDLRHPVTGEPLADLLAGGGLERVERIHPPAAITEPTATGRRDAIDRRDGDTT